MHIFLFIISFFSLLQARDEMMCKNSFECYQMGLVYFSGYNVDVDYDKAFRYFDTACNMGSALACSSLGVMYANGINTQLDYNKAYMLFAKSCEKNDSQGCYNLGMMYADGIDGVVKKDYQKAIKYFSLACEEKDSSACNQLATMYEYAQGVQKDISIAKKLYAKACNLGLEEACKSIR